jgi:hypothetical protein
VRAEPKINPTAAAGYLEQENPNGCGQKPEIPEVM